MIEQSLLHTIQELRAQHPDLVVIIYGPTATGKSGLSLRLADLFSKYSKTNPQSGQNIEIISADSRQVYKYMDIGTDKISQEDRQKVVHYGIDLIDPDGTYTAHQRQTDTKKWINDIHSRGNLPVIVGGTGLYIDTIYKNFSLPPDVPANRPRRAELEQLEAQQPGYLRNLLHTFDPDSATQFHPRNTRYIIRAIEIYEHTGVPKSVLAQERPVDYPLLMVSLTRDVEIANRLIHQRVEEMIDRGLVQEVQGLLDRGYSPDLQSMNGIGYRQTVDWLKVESGKLKNADELYNLINSISLASIQYAKRQRTRFRRYEKDAREHPKIGVHYLNLPMD